MILKILVFFERLIFGSEKLFKFMILNEIENGTLFVEIGSSDLSEAKLVLKQNTKVKALVFEPDKRNISNYDYQILKDKRIKVINKIVSKDLRKKFFYFHKNFSNLNQLSKPSKQKSNFYYKKKIPSTTLDTEIEKIKNFIKLVIKMDIEGYEFDLIKNNLDMFKTKKKVSILIELHPKYYRKNKMKNLINKLIKYGFYFKLVESAGSIRPNIFKKKTYFPFKKSFQRGLYKNIDTDFVLDNAFNLNKGKKVIRSILLTNH